MNIAAFGLGILLLLKWFNRWIIDFRLRPSKVQKLGIVQKHPRPRIYQKSSIFLVALMCLLLLYILTSAINARATFNIETLEYTYFKETNKSLPHSYNARATWFLFWQYLGIIILFWATRDWLLGAPKSQSSFYFNPRIKRMFYLICLNGGILAFECIVQKIYFGDYNGKLLFFIEPSLNISNLNQYGPFAYRSNAASYLNIIWPVSLGLFIQMGKYNLDHKNKRIGNGPEILLLPFTILAASGPIISSARGGAIVMIILLIISTGSLIPMKISRLLKLSVLGLLISSAFTAYFFGWERLESRFLSSIQGLKDRATISETTIKMINEYPSFGSGPGSFEALAQFELGEKFTSWEAWAHNDYLEFLLTFGKPGGTIIMIILVLLFYQYLFFYFSGSNKILGWFCFLALLGVAVHSTMDFPLQVYSIITLLTVIVAALTTPEIIRKNLKE